MAHPNKKIAQVRYRYSDEEIANAASEGYELSKEWSYSPLLTRASAVRYYNELKICGNVVELTLNNDTSPLPC